MEEHNYYIKTQKKQFNINMQYADDISEVTTNNAEIEHLKDKLPTILSDRGLTLNQTKTEENKISRKNDEWKKCKFLGSYIDTENYIKNRKVMLLNAADQLSDIFKNNRLPISIKLKTFDTYLSTIFLYNSELWSLTETMNNKIDSFHRRMLRTLVLNIKYPKIMKNEEVYRKTKQQHWSQKIKTRRLKWLGHVLRLDPRTPAAKSLKYAMERYRKKQGRPKSNWINTVEKQLKEINIKIQDVSLLAQNKKQWRDIVHSTESN